MREHHLAVRRTARYYTIGSSGVDEVWIVCHGYAQLARHFLQRFAPLDDGSRFIVAPEALNRYYYETRPGVHSADARIAATWMTREDREHEIDDYVAYLDQLAAHVTAGAPKRVVALGFSQGTATVSRWAAHGTARIDHVILWAGPPAVELEDTALALRGARLTIVAGSSDSQFPDEQIEQLEARLRAARVPHRLVRHSGGHAIEASAFAAVAGTVRGG
ncbi:MAG TPA: dienelactone hydrolase family protein [Longimicrobiales bacterium]